MQLELSILPSGSKFQFVVLNPPPPSEVIWGDGGGTGGISFCRAVTAYGSLSMAKDVCLFFSVVHNHKEL